MSDNHKPFYTNRESLPTAQKEAFDILYPHMWDPSGTKTNEHPHPNLMDANTPHHMGGTWLANFNLNPVEARLISSLLKELDCPCFFVFLIPSIIGFDLTGDSLKIAAIKKAILLSYNNPTVYAPPPYFAVHCISSGDNCRMSFKQMAIQVFAESEDFATSPAGKGFREEYEGQSREIMKKIMIRKTE
jgi:hypothetical protein